MADTGFKTAGAVVSQTNFTNFTTTRLASSDNSYATTGGGFDGVGVISTFAFGIPSGATIDGIEVTVEAKVGFATVAIVLSLSWNAGTNFTSTKTNSAGTTEATDTYGGAADTWGRTWSDTELSDANFQLKIDPANSAFTISIDQVRAKVYYTAGGLVNVKTVDGLAVASVKTVNGLAIASVETINGLT